jgi:hypothetical protein
MIWAEKPVKVLIRVWNSRFWYFDLDGLPALCFADAVQGETALLRLVGAGLF